MFVCEGSPRGEGGDAGGGLSVTFSIIYSFIYLLPFPIFM